MFLTRLRRWIGFLCPGKLGEFTMMYGVLETRHFHREGEYSTEFGGPNCPVWYWELNSGYESDRPSCRCPQGWPEKEHIVFGLNARAKYA